MQNKKMPELVRINGTLSMLSDCSDMIFEDAPVMMHSINQEGELIKVNRLWLTNLGYERGEVLGRRVVDFMTDESGSQATMGTHPLLWKTGSARSIGYQLIKKNGRVLDVSGDAESRPSAGEGYLALVTLRVGHVRDEWQQAITTLSMLQRLDQSRHRLESILSPIRSSSTDPGLSELQGPAALAATDALLELREVTRELAEYLRSMAQVQANRIDEMVSEQTKLLLLADTLEASTAQIPRKEMGLV